MAIAIPKKDSKKESSRVKESGGKSASVIKSSKKTKTTDTEKKSKKVDITVFSRYIYKVLKQVHPDTGISAKAMSIMNSFVLDVIERIACESSKLAHHNNNKTLSMREIQTATRLILPGELSRHAICEGTKACQKYASSYEKKKKSKN